MQQHFDLMQIRPKTGLTGCRDLFYGSETLPGPRRLNVDFTQVCWVALSVASAVCCNPAQRSLLFSPPPLEEALLALKTPHVRRWANGRHGQSRVERGRQSFSFAIRARHSTSRGLCPSAGGRWRIKS